jgi:hypothetical protein
MTPTEPGRYWAYPSALPRGQSIDANLGVVEVRREADGRLTVAGGPLAGFVFLVPAQLPGLVA